MTSHKAASRQSKAIHYHLLMEEAEALRKKQIRKKRRERRKQIKLEDSTLADAFTSVMVGAEAGGVAPKIGAPIKRNVEMSDLPMKPRRKHPRKTSKKTRERYKKIRERAEKRGDMDIIKPQKTPAAV